MKKVISTMHIAIAGNIGAGKTTLAEVLSKHYGWEAHYEEVDGNPYLNDFYHDMQRWSFNLQIYFLNNRFSQIIDFRNSGKTVIQDRTIYEDAEIFAPNLHEMGLMSTRDFETYHSLFDLMGKLIQTPGSNHLSACLDTYAWFSKFKKEAEIMKIQSVSII